MKTNSPSLPLLLGVLASGVAIAQSVSFSRPAGYFQLTISGQRDNHLSIPLVRPASSFFKVASAGGSSLTAPSGRWARGQFRSTAGQPDRACHAEFTTGALKGLRYRIVDNSEDTLLLDTRGADLTSHPSGAVAHGDVVRLRESWPVGNVFGSTDEDLLLAPRPNASTPGDAVILPDNETTGLNKPPSRELYYLAGSGWRSTADPAADAQYCPLQPGEPFVVRRLSTQDVRVAVIGYVFTGAQSHFVAGGNGTDGNDAYVSLLFPEPVSLDDSGLSAANNRSSSVIRDSPGRVLRGDELLAFGDRSGFDLAPERVFFHQENTGWREAGNSSTTVGTDFMLLPGKAYIIRKMPGHAGGNWMQIHPPDY